MTASRPRTRTRAFTLIELLVVVTVLAVLAAAALPGLANAATPAPRPVADLLEADLRRAKIEAMSALQPMQLVVAADRSRWWLQPLGSPNHDNATPASLRAFGFGALEPYRGFTLEVRIDGELAPSEDVPVALFNDLGSRDEREIQITLVPPVAALEGGDGNAPSDGGEASSESPIDSTWRLEAQRSRFR